MQPLGEAGKEAIKPVRVEGEVFPVVKLRPFQSRLVSLCCSVRLI